MPPTQIRLDRLWGLPSAKFSDGEVAVFRGPADLVEDRSCEKSSSMEVLWKSYGSPMEVLWKSYGSPMEDRSCLQSREIELGSSRRDPASVLGGS